MPLAYLTPEQRNSYGRYTGEPSDDDLARFFYMSDEDHALINRRRGNHNRLGFALQLVTVRYLGVFLDDPLDVPASVLNILAKQLAITDLEGIYIYRTGEQRWAHALEIRKVYGYQDINNCIVGFRLVRWLLDFAGQGQIDQACSLIVPRNGYCHTRFCCLASASLSELLHGFAAVLKTDYTLCLENPLLKNNKSGWRTY